MAEHDGGPGASDASIGDLVSQISAQTSQLVRDELRLAQLEVSNKGKKAGLGLGLFGGAGLVAVFGLGCLVTAAILALAGPLDDWLAAVIVGVALLAVAGAAALAGKTEVAAAMPPVPHEAADGVKKDVQALKPKGKS